MSAAREGRRPLGEVLRIAASVTLYCALGGAVLGGIYVLTERYQEQARTATERGAIAQLLGLGPDARVLEVRQFLDEGRDQVVYLAAPTGADSATRLAFSFEGRLVARGRAAAAPGDRALRPIGRIFVAERGDSLAGFVVEGEAQGYKNIVRFFVALSGGYDLLGVKVVEHEEDPGLGAEVASPWFEGQFAGRPATGLPSLTVTKDPMPEDWRAALLRLGRVPAAEWQARYGGLAARERGRPIYAVSGATISSRALTEGVKSTVGHFRRRWELLAPLLKEST